MVHITGILIPNLDSVGLSTILVLGIVGVIGARSMVKGYRELVRLSLLRQAENLGYLPVDYGQSLRFISRRLCGSITGAMRNGLRSDA